MRNCLSCIHCVFDLGQPDWSELTPGDPVEIRCKRALWPTWPTYERDVRSQSKQDLGAMLDTARTCRQYEPEPWAPKEAT